MAIFMADGTGRVALYSGSDDAPFTNPRANLSRVHFHTDFDYLAFSSAAPTLVSSIEIPALDNSLSRLIVVGAHGKSGVPFVFGQVLLSGAWVPLLGTVPVHRSTALIGGLSPSNVVNWTLAVSDTHIAIAESRSYPNFAALPKTLPVRFWVSDNIMATA